VPSNIAEGYERDSPKETVRFLRITKGSCGELWTQIYIGIEAGFIEKSVGMRLSQEVESVSKMLQGLIKYYHKDEVS
jgi:four helix bundle protein